jgi:hypothetical protein
MRWTGWRKGRARTGALDAGTGVDPLAPVDPTGLRSELERRGVPEEFSLALAERAAGYASSGGPAAVQAVLDGMSIAFEIERSTREQLTRNLRGLREVERMMGAFSGELSKLDEVLGVLAAYVRRMRSSGAAERDRTLH